MPMKAAPYLWQERSSKVMDCWRRSTLTCCPGVPTLEKLCGGNKDSCSFKYMLLNDINLIRIKIVDMNCLQITTCVHPEHIQQVYYYWFWPGVAECDSRTYIVIFLDISDSWIHATISWSKKKWEEWTLSLNSSQDCGEYSEPFHLGENRAGVCITV